MRNLLLGFAFIPALFLSQEARAQAIVLPCVPSGNSCIPVSAANPLPTTGGGGGSGLTVGTTTITLGTTNQLLYDNAGVLGEVATGNSGVLVTSAGGVPSISTTLPSGLTIPGYAAGTITSATATYCAIYSAATTINGYAGCTYTDPGQLGLIGASAYYGLGSASIDTFLTRAAAANWKFGAANAASPVAQTLSVQNVVNGTSNTAGANWTQIASLATGSGTPGDFIVNTGFQGISSTGTATFTNSSANIGYVNSFVAGQAVQFTSSGTLPTNFALLTTYYVIATGLSGSNIQVSATPGGSAITAGSAGSGTQTLVTATIQQGGVAAMTIKGGTQEVVLAGQLNPIAGSTSSPSIIFGSGTGYIYRGASQGGTALILSGANATDAFAIMQSGIGVANVGPYLWTTAISSSFDIALVRDAAAQLAQVNGTNAQSFRVYNTSSSANANYERGVVGWTDTSNVLTIGTQALGTGVVRNMQFVIGGVNKADFGITNASSWNFVGSVSISALANTATTSAVCYNVGTGVLSYDGTLGTCTVSGRQFKNVLNTMDVASLASLHPTVYRYKTESGFDDGHVHVGLLAQDVAMMDDRCAVRNSGGEIVNYEDRCVLAHLVADNDNLRAEVEALRRSIAR